MILGKTYELTRKGLVSSPLPWTGLWASAAGVKISLFRGPVVRPVPKFWKLGFWSGKPLIKDCILTAEGQSELRPSVRRRIIDKLGGRPTTQDRIDRSKDMNYSLYNPWKGSYWFVLRLWLPMVFISIRGKKRGLYFGFKRAKIDPFMRPTTNLSWGQGDITWTDERDEKMANESKWYEKRYAAGCPSASVRSDISK
jgi:hypothetical protein